MSGIGHKNGTPLKKLVRLGEDPNHCWTWEGRVSPITGYGKKQWHGETWLAHRWVYTILLGPIPEGMVVDHICRNRRCVNPHHLELVTQTENCRRGNGSTLTLEQAREIKRLGKHKKWGDGKKLADKYGVSGGLIHDIWNGRAWRDA